MEYFIGVALGYLTENRRPWRTRLRSAALTWTAWGGSPEHSLTSARYVASLEIVLSVDVVAACDIEWLASCASVTMWLLVTERQERARCCFGRSGLFSAPAWPEAGEGEAANWPVRSRAV